MKVLKLIPKELEIAFSGLLIILVKVIIFDIVFLP